MDLFFLATAGHAAYQEVKPAPVSIQLTDEEKKLVDGATFEMSYSTDDLTSSKGAEYALLDGNVKRVGFSENAYSFPNEKRDWQTFLLQNVRIMTIWWRLRGMTFYTA